MSAGNNTIAGTPTNPFSDLFKKNYFFFPRLLGWVFGSAGRTQQASLQDGEEEERLQEGVQEEGQEGVRVRMLYLCCAFSPKQFFSSLSQSTFNINVAIILTHFHESPYAPHSLCTSFRLPFCSRFPSPSTIKMEQEEICRRSESKGPNRGRTVMVPPVSNL